VVKNGWMEVIILPCIDGSVTELSVTAGCRWQAVTTKYAALGAAILVNIAHSRKSSHGPRWTELDN
jgi:hypothetical protein